VIIGKQDALPVTQPLKQTENTNNDHASFFHYWTGRFWEGALLSSSQLSDAGTQKIRISVQQ